MLNNLIVVSVTAFSGTTSVDKNGENPVMLQCIAGVMPNRNVLSGTVAKRTGIEIGKTYLMNVREAGVDDLFGTDFTFTKVQELTSALDIVKAVKELGEPKIITIGRPREKDWSDLYQRKSNAIEGQRTIREKEGKYHRSIPSTTIHHESSPDVEEGTSVDSGGKILHDIGQPKEKV